MRFINHQYNSTLSVYERDSNDIDVNKNDVSVLASTLVGLAMVLSSVFCILINCVVIKV